jgi:hypothetical protein
MKHEALSGVQTRNPSNEATADLCFRPSDTGIDATEFTVSNTRERALVPYMEK